jgi:O-methyltransferase
MFNLNKVNKARKRLEITTSVLFKLFQINLRYKEKRNDYGIEIFEYFYLPWRSDNTFIEAYSMFSEYTLNPKSRLYTIYDFAKNYLIDGTSFVEVGSWRGGVSGLVAYTNLEKNIDYFVCDTFQGVANSSDKDSFFKDNEYSDAEVNHLKEVENLAGTKFEIIEGIFPESMENTSIKKPISFAHIDVDTYISAKESLNYIMKNATKNALVVLDDYGGWFTDGVTKLGNELKNDKKYFVAPNHLGQLLIFKIN